ncbi:MAG: DUF3566 domain-containing protein [Anaerolineae bacterium]|nr:DUF3566 domain-containing protein [Anaerolineae bacterium]
MVTVKRIDIVSAMRVGALVYAIMFTVFALLWALFQSLILSGLSSLANNSSLSFNGVPQSGFNAGSLATAGLAGCACGYLLGIVAAAIGGGIFGLVLSFSYNLVANWFGGLRVRVEADEAGPLEKLKREM